ncbi:exo-alpha-sialidase [Planctomycetes bacterium Pan216]
MRSLLVSITLASICVAQTSEEYPHPANNPDSPKMLAGDWFEHPHGIDFTALPKIPSRHVVVSDVKKTKGVNQHNYLAHHDRRYWVMWSDGPGVEDRAGQVVKYATSPDGLEWTSPKQLTPDPKNSGPGSAVFNTRSPKGFRWIARGFWQRDGELLALASLDEAAGFFGPSLALHAFRWNADDERWDDLGVIRDNAINNFPPKQLPSGRWMMSRRPSDYKRVGVSMLVGGDRSLQEWKSFPVLETSSKLAAEEPYWWLLPDGKSIAALFRDNRRSGYLYRSFSVDDGRTWSTPVKTDFPDARSKFHGLRLRDGRYVLVSNTHPRRRDPLTLSVSEDGLVFTKMGYLYGGRHVDYPHVMEHDGQLFVAFAGGKQSVEVLKVDLDDLDLLDKMPTAIAPRMPLK